MNNKKLVLRRAKNRKREGLEKHSWRKMNSEIYAVAESSLPGFRWVQRRNPNDATGFSWYEERINNI